MTDWIGVDVQSVPDVKNVIYALSCACHPDDGIRYVGLTSVALRKRLQQHLGGARRGGAGLKNNWVRKHGEANVVVSVLEEVEKRELLPEAEIEWIAELRSQGASLLNLCDGGQGPNGIVWTAEQRAVSSRKAKQAFADGTREPSFLGRHHEADALRIISEKAQARYRAGQPGGAHTLTKADAVEVLRFPANFTLAAIGELYGVQKSAIGKIFSGRTWRTLDRSTMEPRNHSRVPKFSDVQVAEIVTLRREGHSLQELGEQFGVSFSHIGAISRAAGIGRFIDSRKTMTLAA